MFDLAILYCRGYVALPLAQALSQRGNSGADASEAGAVNAGAHAVAMEALAAAGFPKTALSAALRRDAADAMRLYAHAPEECVADPRLASLLCARLRMVFADGSDPGAGGDPEAGALMAPLLTALATVDADRFVEALDRDYAAIAADVRGLFQGFGWLDGGALSAAGRAMFAEIASLRRVLAHRRTLAASAQLLYGDYRAARTTLPQEDIDDARIDRQRVADIVRISPNADALAAAANTQALSQASMPSKRTYVDAVGAPAKPTAAFNAWAQAFEALAQGMDASPAQRLALHGPVRVEANLTGMIDGLRRLAGECPIDAETCLVLAAGAGLFNDGPVLRQPTTPSACDWTLHAFERRDYRVRHAELRDLDRLCVLEKLCWRHTRTPRNRIRDRVRKHPEGQFVLEKNGEVLGVIYSQRIRSADALDACTAADVHGLHDPQGSTVQLLAVNIDPAAQHLNYGDQLLEFMLQRCALVEGVDRVVGVTLCKSFRADSGETFADYIGREGAARDPVLSFHYAHGAEIVKPIPGYRPEDSENLCNGVLVSYDILHRQPRRGAAAATTAPAADADFAALDRLLIDGVAATLGITAAEVDRDRPVMEMGLDSADLLQLQQRLEEATGLRLDAGFFFVHGTLRRALAHCRERLNAAVANSANANRAETGAEAARNVAEAPAAYRIDAVAHDDRMHDDRMLDDDARSIAIVGMACKLPGGIETTDALWRSLIAGESKIDTYPSQRGVWADPRERAAIDRGGFVHDADAFDAAFFRMSPAEAEVTDPQQRMLMELAWACAEDAGVPATALQGTRTGVFVGASNTDYSRLLQQAGREIEAHHGVGSSLAILANRISYFFDLSGPSLLVDTACSSSLVALHMAVQSLRSGECPAALVGGVNLICHPDLSIAYHKAGMLAADGLCKTFDARADGYVRSEGAVMLLLKPLRSARADGDRIHALIRGTAVNHGGLASGLTVPNPQKQSELLLAAWKDADIDARRLSYLEAHGTGTALGDPIEVQGMRMALAEANPGGSTQTDGCAIGSIKSNLGHLESAAGLAGLLKVVLAMRHRTLPASLHFQRLNPKIDLSNTALRVQDTLGEWSSDCARIAGVSSFGSGGANAHAVLEEYPQPAPELADPSSLLCVLSAADGARLREVVARALTWLRDPASNGRLGAAIRTWQLGRSAMRARLAIVADDRGTLIEGLQRWLNGDADATRTWSGTVDGAVADAAEVERALSARRLDRLGALWVAGAAPDWRRLHTGEAVAPISLPTYPFARDRFWAVPAAMAAHPLLQTRDADSAGPRYRARFGGDEFFFAEHRVRDRRVLPAVACLEMVVAAAIDAGLGREGALELRDLAWTRPLAIDEGMPDESMPAVEATLAFASTRGGDTDFELLSATGDGEQVHCQGTLVRGFEAAAPAALDPLALQARMVPSPRDANTFYADYARIGLDYGPHFRAVETIHTGNDELIARLQLPAAAEGSRGRFRLHPSLLDGALQATLALIADDDVGTPVPFALDRALVFADSADTMYVHVRRRNEPGVARAHAKLDLDLCDASGRVCVRFEGFATRRMKATAAAGELVAYAPVWMPVHPEALAAMATPSNGRVLLLGANSEQLEWLRASRPDADAVALAADAEIDTWRAALEGREFDHLLWIAPDTRILASDDDADHDADTAAERMVAAQAEGTLVVFRALKALLALGYGDRELRWTLITGPTLRTSPQDRLRPAHAGVSGLVGSLAKEFAHWRLSLIDADTLAQTSAADCLAIPPAPRGDALALRRGEWFRPTYARMRAMPPQARDAEREGGVYVVIGGAGGLGEAWTRDVVERRRAQVVWIGRGARSEAIERKIAEIAAFGPAPVYLSADATDADALAGARDEILARFGAIHGVVHSALVLHDRGLAQMEEPGFRVALAAKVDVAANIDLAFGALPLDFLLFFSSMMSFLKPPGQANYVAGCTFKDSFAQALARKRGYPVKLVHWGFWGGVGSVADETYRRSMLRNGIGSIEAGEGLRALRAFLDSDLDRLGLIRTAGTGPVADLAFAEEMFVYPTPTAAAFAREPVFAVSAEGLTEFGGGLCAPALEPLLEERLAATLQALGLVGEQAARRLAGTSAAWHYQRWLDHSLAYLRERGWLDAQNLPTRTPRSLDALAVLWSEAERAWRENPNLRAQIALADACVAALPQILRGERPATEVMFPDASMRLVEGIYRDNAVSDAYNQALADTLVAYAAQRTAQASGGLRMLEIGAGTGGTTARLIPALADVFVEEYCYTDVSRAFLMYAEEHYKPRFAPLTTALFDVSRPLSAQTIAPAAYDAVIATNVLHATADIRETLRNAKAALKPGGLLLLNEISNWSLFSHLTFGLLEGWWLHADAALRLPGSPGISPEGWRDVLLAEGFDPVLYPARELHGLGQQIVAAVSDGRVRQRIEIAAATPAVAVAARAREEQSADAQASLRERAIAHLRGLVADTLRMPAERIEARRPLADYGLDSILVGQLTYRLRKDFAEVPATLFFEARDLEGVTEHFLRHHRDALAALLAPNAVAGAPSAPTTRDRATAGEPSTLAAQGGSLRQRAIAYLRGLISATLKLPESSIDLKRPLADYGLDSILVGQLTYRLRKDFAEVPATLFFEVGHLEGLVEHFLARHAARLEEVLGTDPAAVSPRGSQSPTSAIVASGASSDAAARAAQAGGVFDVAIVGLSGRYPQSENLDAFWDNLANGRSCITEIPRDRWRWEDYYDAERGQEGRMYTRWGGFLDGIDRFDPLFFRIAPKDAWRIDPQERLFLEACYHAIEDAGYTPDTLDAPERVGVFVGVMNARYTAQPSHYSIANRVSYAFDFQGPSMAVDTACSSSLTAIHVALDSLYGGTTRCAIVGGVNLIVDPVHFLELTGLNMLSEGDRCRAFGANADGFVDAEGVGAIVLKPLDRARAEGDRIYAVIKGSAVNAGGRTHGYTVPNPNAQAGVVAQALERANLPADHLSYIEAHGTGTSLGDPIEIAGLTRAFGEAATRRQFCAIGSVKSNIGHCESAAGIAGVTKVLLQLRHRKLVPSLHAEEPNPEIDFARSPFKVQKTLGEWPRPLRDVDGVLQEIPRIAGVSSFGAGGANAHVILQEYIAPVEAPVVHARVLVPLSARTAAQLRRKAEDLAAFLRKQEAHDLTATAYTLQIGREAMDERFACVVGDVAALLRHLDALAAGAPIDSSAFRAHARREREALARLGDEAARQRMVARWIDDGALDRLAEVWTQGEEIAWAVLYRDARPKRIGLPMYPFARDRHWRDPSVASPAVAPHGALSSALAGAASVRLHPLLHSNSSDLHGLRLSSEFGGASALLSEYAIELANGTRRGALSAAALLEMARAGLDHAQPASVDASGAASAIELRDVQLAQPFAPQGEARLHLSLWPSREGAAEFEIHSDDNGVECVHAQGAAARVALESHRIDLTTLRARLSRGESAEAMYAGLAQWGLHCGPRYQAATTLSRGTNEALVELRRPAQAEAMPLSPELLEGALHAAWSLLQATGEGGSVLQSIAQLRVWSALPAEALAWVRRVASNEGAQFEIDLCDAQGQICASLRGCRWEHIPSTVGVSDATASRADFAAHSAAAAPTDVVVAASPRATVAADAPVAPVAAQAAPVVASPKRVPLFVAVPTAGAEQALPPANLAVREKPRSIALSSVESMPAALPAANAVPKAQVSVRLSDIAAAVSSAPISDAVSLYDCGDGVFEIRIDNSRIDNGDNHLDTATIEALLQAIAHVRSAQGLKALSIAGHSGGFLRGGRAEVDAAIAAGLYRELANLPCPTIAVAQGDALGAGFLLASLCDLMVLSETAHYGFTDPTTGVYPSEAELALFAARHGAAQADALLYGNAATTGAALRAQGWGCAVVTDAAAHARELLNALRAKTALSLGLLKPHLTRAIAEAVAALTPVGAPAEAKATTASRGKTPSASKQLPASKHMRIETLDDGVLSVRLRAVSRKADAKAMLADLSALLSVPARDDARAILLSSDDSEFLPAALRSLPERELLDLQRRIAHASRPVVAALQGDAHGAAWLIAASCAVCVLSDNGRYGAVGLDGAQIASIAMASFGRAYGASGARMLLLDTGDRSGAQLRACTTGAIVRPDAEVLSAAGEIAHRLAALPAATRAAWTAWRAAAIETHCQALVQVAIEDARDGAPDDALASNDGPTRVALNSSVIALTAYPDGVVLVEMADRDARNMFSDALMAGLDEAFAHIAATPAYKAVVLTGYDHYFSAGGTRENLLAIQRGETRFTDHRTFEIATHCALPVIAAMQGHGIGAGWTLGLFADVSVFASESRYRSPYMEYGFTPGAGATWVLADRMGHELAFESLCTGHAISGAELQARALRLPIVPRDEAVATALAMAHAAAGRAGARLRALKRMWTAPARAAMEATYRAELAMHEATFVGDAETLARIERTLGASSSEADAVSDGSAANASSVVAPVVGVIEVAAALSSEHASAPSPVFDAPAASRAAAPALGEISAVLRGLLAQELHLSESDIDDHIQFVDLGLDSISGVTWVRKINQHYATTIEATRVYAYPTLAQLSAFVQGELRANAPVVVEPAAVVAQPVAVSAPAPMPAVATSLATSAAIDASPSRALDPTEVQAVLRRLLAQELHLSESEIDDHIQFVDLGLDSISGVTWVRKINQHYGIEIEATRVYAYPTLVQLARYVAGEVAPQQSIAAPVPAVPVPAVPVPTAQVPTAQVTAPPAADLATHLPVSRQPLSQPWPSAPVSLFAGFKALHARRPRSARLATATASPAAANASTAPIAVIGMAGRFPMAGDTEAFWRNIAEGRDCMSQVSAERWDPERYYRPGAPSPGKSYCRWLGALEDYDRFDPLFFGLSPREAESMDPQQRLFMETCYHAIEYAGYDPRALSGSRCGVFVGCASGDYHLLSREQQTSALGFTGEAMSILAARISYALDLQGPCLSIDTACSSSLVAIATACDSLNNGTSDLALAGGVYVMSGPEMHIKTCQGGMLSPNGRCFTFDQRADGFAIGEGVGAIVLKRLSDAERDEDNILGLIEGWGVNQDGKTNGITAPNPESQTRLECEVYDRFGIDPAGIQLIEAHGTGTKLGDPIEVEALKHAFARYTRDTGYCALGSVKSNIGHCLTAAGVAGTIKLLLALKHQQLPPTVHYQQLNEHIALDGSPFYVNDRLRPWQVAAGTKRRAAVSSFGFSGTNAHLIVGEAPAPAHARAAATMLTEAGQAAIPLSAKTPQQLKQRARDLAAFLRTEGAGLSLEEVAHTLQLGREAMEERVAFLAASTTQLIERLLAWADGDARVEGCHEGQVKRSRESVRLLSQDEDMKAAIVDRWLAQRRLGKLLELWVKGVEFDWRRLYGEQRPHRVALPLYPFARERYWIDSAPIAESGSHARTAALNAVLHTNASDFSGQRYRSRFSGDESALLRDDAGVKSLAPMACVEMARSALLHAFGHGLASDDRATDAVAIELRDVVWATTSIAATGDPGIEIALSLADEGGVDFDIARGSDADAPLLCQGRAELLDAASLKVERVDLDAFRAGLREATLASGEHPALQHLVRDEQRALASLRTPASAPTSTASGADAALRAVALFEGVLSAVRALSGAFTVPVAIDSLRVYGEGPDHAMACIQRYDDTASGIGTRFDATLCDATGAVFAELRGLRLCAASEAVAVTNAAETNAAVTDAAATDFAQNAAADATSDTTTELLFEELWTPVAAIESNTAATPLRLVVLGDAAFAARFAPAQSGGKVRALARIEPGAAFERIDDVSWHCPIDDNDAIARALDAAIAATGDDASAPLAVVCAWARGQGARGVHALFALFKAVRDCAHPIAQTILVGDYDQARVETCWDYAWIGFERSLRGALSSTRVALLLDDADGIGPTQVADAWARGGVAWYRAGQRHELVCRPMSASELAQAEAADAPTGLREGGVYLITGGAGALGLRFARDLAARCRPRLLLLGRRARTPEIEAQLEALRAAGAQDAEYHAVDIADGDALRAWAAALPHPVNGILHAAGVESDRPFHEKSAIEIDRVLLPKTVGSRALDEAFATHPLDFVAYFSSAAAAFGDLGACDYALANRFQVGYAQWRSHDGRLPGRAQAIQWPLWAEGAMGLAHNPQSAAFLKMSAQEYGNRPLTSEAGIGVWNTLRASDRRQALVMVGKPGRVEAFVERVYRGVPAPAPAAKPAATTTPPTAPVAAVDETRLRDELRASLAATLRMQPQAIGFDQSFGDLGLDSYLGLEWINALNARYGVDLSNIAVYDYPSVAAMAARIAADLRARRSEATQIESATHEADNSAASTDTPTFASDTTSAVHALSSRLSSRRGVSAGARASVRGSVAKTSARADASDDKIAIVGMSGRYPQAPDLEAFWRNLAEGRDAIVEVPAWRWDADRFYDPAASRIDAVGSKWLGAVDGIDCFDPLFFRISPHEAVHMDPQHRLFLEESYRAFENAGYAPDGLNEAKCGVYLGIGSNEYALLLSRHGALSATVTGHSNAIAAARIAYYLNLKGPAICIDTACSSSLVAIHLACRALADREIEMALAGGVSVWFSAESFQGMTRAGMLSADGRCKAFDDGADGIVVGDGVGAVVLKRLRDAEADGDIIHGVIVASGINQDGRTNGITAPSATSQMSLLRDVYDRYRIDPAGIGYIEAHGTGTKLGDPIELTALATVFGERTDRKRYCGIGSVKSNIGHTTSAAGIAGVHKALLAIRHRTLPPTLHVRRENANFDFASSPFFVCDTARVWHTEADAPRRAAVSSFGFSGTNAHLVIEEYRAPTRPSRSTATPQAIVLSARTAERLTQKARELSASLREGEQGVAYDLADIAYTLQCGREAMEERVAFLVASVDELRAQLDAFAENGALAATAFRDRVDPDRDDVRMLEGDEDLRRVFETWVAQRKLGKLLEYWVKGLAVDWRRVHDDGRVRRVALPSYPFARERYWIEGHALPASVAIDAPVDAAADRETTRSIEEIVGRIESDAIETAQAVRMLKQLV